MKDASLERPVTASALTLAANARLERAYRNIVGPPIVQRSAPLELPQGNDSNAAPTSDTTRPVTGSRRVGKENANPQQHSAMGGAVHSYSEAELSERFEALYRSGTSNTTGFRRTLYGAQHQRHHAVQRPPAPRTAQQLRQGLLIQARNVDAVRAPQNVGCRSPERGRRTSPPGLDARERLHEVASTVSQRIALNRQAIEEKHRRVEGLDTQELRKQVFPYHQEVEQLVLRVCSWHVTLSVLHSGRAIASQLDVVRELRRAQVAANERAWKIVARNLYPATRRWVRRMRLRRCYRVFLCALFAVKLSRGRRHRGINTIRLFLTVVARDRAFALHRFQNIVRRSIRTVDRAFRCRKALRAALDEQWMAMETTILLFQFHLLPDVVQIPGWKDEISALRLKLLHLAPQLPPLEEDGQWIDVPLYLIRALKWRCYYRKHRPVGVFDETRNRLPQSLAFLCVPPDVRGEKIEAHLDAAYNFRRQKVLDNRVAAINKLRNIEEWRDRQRLEVVHHVGEKYPAIVRDSVLFQIVCAYELEVRTRSVGQAASSNDPNRYSRRRAGGQNAALEGAEQQLQHRSTYRMALRQRLMDEFDLFQLVREALQERVVLLKEMSPAVALQAMRPATLTSDRGEGDMMRRRSTMRLPLTFEGAAAVVAACEASPVVVCVSAPTVAAVEDTGGHNADVQNVGEPDE